MPDDSPKKRSSKAQGVVADASIHERSDRRLDLIVYGATSFVGQILCRHLVERHGVNGSLRWAIAGRSRSKLDQVAADTGAEVERIVADASDHAALVGMASRARVIVSTVGPYALYGSTLVRAVVETGTDYCDLTGEPQWIRRMLDAHESTAQQSGARILHACGFDSIPSDLGVWFTEQQFNKRHGSYCDQVSMRVKAFSGGASGGTIASMVNLVGEATNDSELRKLLMDPYALTPTDGRVKVDQPQHRGPFKDRSSGQWAAPFVMDAINTRIVHRSHALLGHPWGENFRYDEAMQMGSGPLGLAKSAGFSGGLIAAMGATAVGPVRKALSDHVLPKPGTGPSPEAQEKGYFDIRFHGRGAGGREIRTKVTGNRDPGYGCTAKMLGETAVALLEDVNGDRVGGFWTPASLFAENLIKRLQSHAGMTFEVLN